MPQGNTVSSIDREVSSILISYPDTEVRAGIWPVFSASNWSRSRRVCVRVHVQHGFFRLEIAVSLDSSCNGGCMFLTAVGRYCKVSLCLSLSVCLSVSLSLTHTLFVFVCVIMYLQNCCD